MSELHRIVFLLFVLGCNPDADNHKSRHKQSATERKAKSVKENAGELDLQDCVYEEISQGVSYKNATSSACGDDQRSTRARSLCLGLNGNNETKCHRSFTVVSPIQDIYSVANSPEEDMYMGVDDTEKPGYNVMSHPCEKKRAETYNHIEAEINYEVAIDLNGKNQDPANENMFLSLGDSKKDAPRKMSALSQQKGEAAYLNQTADKNEAAIELYDNNEDANEYMYPSATDVNKMRDICKAATNLSARDGTSTTNRSESKETNIGYVNCEVYETLPELPNANGPLGTRNQAGDENPATNALMGTKVTRGYPDDRFGRVRVLQTATDTNATSLAVGACKSGDLQQETVHASPHVDFCATDGIQEAPSAKSACTEKSDSVYDNLSEENQLSPQFFSL